jgi:two-component system phosphate regulon sensor histidine kinase PhoR
VSTIQRLFTALVILVALGSAAAYVATYLTLHDEAPLGIRAVWLFAALPFFVSVLLLLIIARLWRGNLSKFRRQLDQMVDSGGQGMIVLDGKDELTRLADRLNQLITQLSGDNKKLNIEKKELQIQLRVAETEKQHAEAIIYSISDAVLVTDAFGDLVVANEAAENTLGFRFQEVYRRPLDEAITDRTLIKLVNETRESHNKVPRRVVEHATREGGEDHTYNVTLSSVVDRDDRVNGVVAVLHDITREKEVAKMKSDFVSSVSHELRTPLSSLKGFVEMLIDGEAGDEKTRREFYEIIQAETDRLNRLIDNILNISRIEAGVIKVAKTDLSLAVVITEAVEVMRPQAKAKNIEIVEQLSPVYYQVHADRDMLYQVVLNLLSNAVKYTKPGGKVIVRTTVEREVVRTDVTDTGLGISAEDLPKIFDKFYRVEANKKVASGTGLGLSLVKHIVETVHDGRLSVTSEVGVGSTFGFEVPLVR